MMELDPINNLNQYPLIGWFDFIDKCKARSIKEINLTGTNTDPLLYKELKQLVLDIRYSIVGCSVGIRTNGCRVPKIDLLKLFDEVSVSVTSFNPDLYQKTMGEGSPPVMEVIRYLTQGNLLRANVVLCPETKEDVWATLDILRKSGVSKVNLREPYGQPHIGNPFDCHDFKPKGTRLGMPYYDYYGLDVTYWDVHYCEVESVNLYANGKVSETYPITKGYSDNGKVIDQNEWKTSGRHVEQWIKPRSE